MKDSERIILKYESYMDEHEVTAYIDGVNVGHLHWDDVTREINWVEVHPDHRRQGVGRAMWDYSQGFRTPPCHSPYRSKAGNSWAHAVGGEIPELELTDELIDFIFA